MNIKLIDEQIINNQKSDEISNFKLNLTTLEKILEQSGYECDKLNSELLNYKDELVDINNLQDKKYKENKELIEIKNKLNYQIKKLSAELLSNDRLNNKTESD